MAIVISISIIVKPSARPKFIRAACAGGFVTVRRII
jgi:hypothetical protein